MPVQPFYAAGTATVANGSATVTGTGTAWSIGVVNGGEFSLGGYSVPIASIDSNASLTLAYPWPQATTTGPYAISLGNSGAASAITANERLAQFVAAMSEITPYARQLLGDADAAEALATLDSTEVGAALLKAVDEAAARDAIDLSRGLQNPFVQSPGLLTDNVNVVTRLGQYLVSTGAVGVPAGFSQGLCFVKERWNGQLIQELYEIVPPFSVYHRNYLSETFGPWQRHLTGGSFAEMRALLGVAYDTTGEKQAFLSNIGAQPAGNYQPNLGWKPIEVVDPTVEVSAIVIAIPPSARSIRLTGVISAVTTTSAIRCRVSFDGAATFEASTIYRVIYFNRGGGTIDQSSASLQDTSFYAAIGQQNNAQVSDIDLRLDYVFPRAARYRSRCAAISSDGSEREVVTTGSLGNVNPPTHFMLFAELGGNISPETRLLVEAF